MKKRTKPVSLGTRIDKLFELREQIREMNAELKALKSSAFAYENKVMRALREQELDSGKGSRATVTVGTRKFVKMLDRNKVDKYVKRNDAFDLFSNRINIKAVIDRLEEGEKIPGIEVDEMHFLHVTKR